MYCQVHRHEYDIFHGCPTCAAEKAAERRHREALELQRERERASAERDQRSQEQQERRHHEHLKEEERRAREQERSDRDQEDRAREQEQREREQEREQRDEETRREEERREAKREREYYERMRFAAEMAERQERAANERMRTGIREFSESFQDYWRGLSRDIEELRTRESAFRDDERQLRAAIGQAERVVETARNNASARARNDFVGRNPEPSLPTDTVETDAVSVSSTEEPGHRSETRERYESRREALNIAYQRLLRHYEFRHFGAGGRSAVQAPAVLSPRLAEIPDQIRRICKAFHSLELNIYDKSPETWVAMLLDAFFFLFKDLPGARQPSDFGLLLHDARAFTYAMLEVVGQNVADLSTAPITRDEELDWTRLIYYRLEDGASRVEQALRDEQRAIQLRAQQKLADEEARRKADYADDCAKWRERLRAHEQVALRDRESDPAVATVLSKLAKCQADLQRRLSEFAADESERKALYKRFEVIQGEIGRVGGEILRGIRPSGRTIIDLAYCPACRERVSAEAMKCPYCSLSTR